MNSFFDMLCLFFILLLSYAPLALVFNPLAVPCRAAAAAAAADTACFKASEEKKGIYQLFFLFLFLHARHSSQFDAHSIIFYLTCGAGQLIAPAVFYLSCYFLSFIGTVRRRRRPFFCVLLLL